MSKQHIPLYALTPITETEGLEDDFYVVVKTQHILSGEVFLVTRTVNFINGGWKPKHVPNSYTHYLNPLPPSTQVLEPGMVAVSEEAMNTVMNALKSIAALSEDEGARSVAKTALTKLAQMGDK